jgi:hypothetical protein
MPDHSVQPAFAVGNCQRSAHGEGMLDDNTDPFRGEVFHVSKLECCSRAIYEYPQKVSRRQALYSMNILAMIKECVLELTELLVQLRDPSRYFSLADRFGVL